MFWKLRHPPIGTAPVELLFCVRKLDLQFPAITVTSKPTAMKRWRHIVRKIINRDTWKSVP
jgi:hypothetical protein